MYTCSVFIPVIPAIPSYRLVAFGYWVIVAVCWSSFLLSEFGKRSLLGNRVDAARANISLTDVRKLQLQVPPIELQREFARRVTAVEKLKTAHRASLAELDALFATLQHRAFRGEL